MRELCTGENVLFMDFYELTMAQLYFRYGLHTKNVQFDYFFRNYPDYGGHQAGYCINAGLEWFIDWIRTVSFDNHAIELLRNRVGSNGSRIFSDDFLDYLREVHFDSLHIKAVPEGRVIHPLEPVVIVNGELCAAQLVESSLLNNLNYQILIATKASRIYEAGNRRPVIEFGMRRAQHTGANAGARAALIGGADYTSNTGFSLSAGLTPRGTHAHSMIQLFLALGEGELEAFRAYASVYPDDCLLLVDTVNTLESGVPNAIKVFEELRKKGHRPAGIRLDSGDLAYLSVKAARMLDKAGFEDTVIVLSNNIDEMVLLQVLRQVRDEAPLHGMDPQKIINRFVYGVGTKLITSQGRSALDGVYKLAAVDNNGEWVPSFKISDSPGKTLIPGAKQVWRIYDRENMAIDDLIGMEDEIPEKTESLIIHHPSNPDISRIIERSEISIIEPLLLDILKDGKLNHEFEPLENLRSRRINDLQRLDPGVRRLINPHNYHVSLTENLWKLKKKLLSSMNFNIKHSPYMYT